VKAMDMKLLRCTEGIINILNEEVGIRNLLIELEEK
jgi:hypothetical protein